MIKTGYVSPQTAFFCILVCIIHASSEHLPSPDDPSGNCVLNFKEFPYQPTGECIGGEEKVKYLASIGTTLCCRNVLNVLTKNLARQANNSTNGDLFISQNQWKSCSGNFVRQNAVSPHNCGFDYLYKGSHACSSFTLSSVQQKLPYINALDSCSDFGFSFDDACHKCTRAIMEIRDYQLAQLGVPKGDGAGTSICTLAAVISVVAAKLDDRPLIDDFYSCLSTMEDFDAGYVKLKRSVVNMVLAILIATVVLMLVLLLVQYVTKSKRKQLPRPVAQSEENSSWSGLYRFSKAEIQNAIKYGKDWCLGEGSAGHVYRGVLPSGQIVAIKHIHKHNTGDSFQREVEGLSRVRHTNLVCLFGCCIADGDRYLVYEYCSAGNLAQHLLRKDAVLTWEKRVQILRGCARGLRYLHHYVDGCIVHRDIKLTNILLTEDLEPKLSDFGLARMLGMEESKVFTDVRGTIGYMDPEYMSNAKLTSASDIYSFGIVILQLLSGKKAIDLDLDARDQLARRAKDVTSGKRPPSDFQDPRLEGTVNQADYEAILQIAVLCVAKSSKGRPTVDVVYEELEKAWRNTFAYMKERHEKPSPSLETSVSFDAIPV